MRPDGMMRIIRAFTPVFDGLWPGETNGFCEAHDRSSHEPVSWPRGTWPLIRKSGELANRRHRRHIRHQFFRHREGKSRRRHRGGRGRDKGHHLLPARTCLGRDTVGAPLGNCRSRRWAAVQFVNAHSPEPLNFVCRTLQRPEQPAARRKVSFDGDGGDVVPRFGSAEKEQFSI